MDMGRNDNGRRTEWQWTLDGTWMDVGWNGDECRTKWWRTLDEMVELTTTKRNSGMNYGITEQHNKMDCDYDGLRQWRRCKASTSTSSAAMACRRKDNFFFLLRVFVFFYSFLLLLPELLQGLLTTWLQAQKYIGVHSLNVNFKTHVQGK
jgi:hypothetical protein